MGFSVQGHKWEADSRKDFKRLHKTVPYIESQLSGADPESLVFSQRHEASTIELFFDLFFVANVATFTAYHSVTDSSYLLAYIGFFGILWSCWFQVTLHDVRFARDSIYERACKTIQFIVFVGLALVGSSFNPNLKKGKEGNNTNFRILCYVLVISRMLLATQYTVVLAYTMVARYRKLYIPLGLIIAVYAAAAVVFAAMTPAFRTVEQSHRHIYLVWYVVMLLEAISIIAISCCRRMLSFKRTHLMERMSLLTLIVIGEGAIGVTKTVSRMMGKSGLDVESCFLVMCIILILVLLWALYFDNFPHGHYGTIRQQIWSLLHFPFQLAVVGVVEGSQQVALARYVLKNYTKFYVYIMQYCMVDNLDGQQLQDALGQAVDYFQFDSRLETRMYLDGIQSSLELIGNSTDICSPTNTSAMANYLDWPEDFHTLVYQVFDALYQSLGMKLPVDKGPTAVAIRSWKTVYIYYWSSFCLLMACSIVFLFLIRRHKADLFDFVSVIVRILALSIGGILIALVANELGLYNFISSPAVLPTCLSLLLLVLFFDRTSAAIANWRLRRSGQPYTREDADEHHHGNHGCSQEHDHDTHHNNHKSIAMSTFSADTTPLIKNAAYHGANQGYVTSAMSPPATSPTPSGHAHGGYMPVNSG
ncbi:hypothetical protein K469DRAFT_603999 [Zopfia rhizophila CBS 207.26]|uniref:Low temperature requirement A n=1 Tax=Zopfia rhizophila CBS 207.26 TaxID=1314779 RepID=A0A6A6DCI8_9PEZI|nr:hypothetical protein K469DRAFT_603999 [Zopfia rhizophila CBS 207.26]